MRWGMVSVVPMKAGTIVWAREMLYKAVMQAVLIYGSERWVLTESTMNFLEGFHQRIYHRIVGKMARHVGEEG